MRTAAAVLFLGLLLGVAIFSQVWKYRECRRSGNTKTYCMLEVGR